MAAKKQNEKKKKEREIQEPVREYTLRDEIISILMIAAAVYLFICNFGIGGKLGQLLSSVMFGFFGLRAYLAPLCVLAGALFLVSNGFSFASVRKTVAGCGLFFLAGILVDLVTGRLGSPEGLNVAALYRDGATTNGGGGILPGLLGTLMYRNLSVPGTLLIVLVAAIICLVVITDRSFIRSVRNRSHRLGEELRTQGRRHRERPLPDEEDVHVRRDAERHQKAHKQPADTETEEPSRFEKKKTGVTTDTTLRAEDHVDAADTADTADKADTDVTSPVSALFGADEAGDEIHEITYEGPEEPEEEAEPEEDQSFAGPEPVSRRVSGIIQKAEGAEDFEMPSTRDHIERTKQAKQTKQPKPGVYKFPPLKLLNAGDRKKAGNNAESLAQTAAKLAEVLETFGVKATVDPKNCSIGPTVTRYEVVPEAGVKVSRIINLSDDIKLNLAATDIRIEAPIPGKVAVGIEVPNAENVTVTLRELLESAEYKTAESKLSFAAGKDISGSTVVTDIAKMPHLLIAGSTGSGKSVCINTLVLSILYKAHPDEVKLIMIDPKVVELNTYNGIPHMLIPVVTDPKKAAGALNWAVAEMEKRYRTFADAEVRDLAGYNKYVELHEGEEGFEKLPQIVLIVDELADLMMVSKSELETAICRLAQLARAAGIHLIIATQRPSVDVITGLIKANMPSRIAFAVSSGTDSRTILDMNGAEKLLGKGDMLFFPQSYSKPVRVQGAFVSDKEIQDVCAFLKSQDAGEKAKEKAEEIETSIAEGVGTPDAPAAGASDRDEYFVEAGRFIIGKEKASIGNLQRVFKIGFNRAARIMDQLCEAGVVGEEAGTKPREILMSLEEFERICNQGEETR